VQTGALLRYALSRRWRAELGGTLAISGGADREAQERLPRLRTAELDAALGFRRSRRDELVTRASGARIYTSNGYDHVIITLAEEWAMDWTAETRTDLSAGAALYDTSGPARDETTQVSGLAAASLTHAIRARDFETLLSLSIAHDLAPNVLLGTVQRQVAAVGEVAVSTAAARAALTLAAGQTLPPSEPGAARLYSAGLAFDRELLDWLAMQLGAEVSRQELIAGALDEPTLSLWLIYAGLEARMLETRFRCC
jgi:hypothetical protein